MGNGREWRYVSRMHTTRGITLDMYETKAVYSNMDSIPGSDKQNPQSMDCPSNSYFILDMPTRCSDGPFFGEQFVDDRQGVTLPPSQ